jgi:enterochelin esterase-like enzyme
MGQARAEGRECRTVRFRRRASVANKSPNALSKPGMCSARRHALRSRLLVLAIVGVLVIANWWAWRARGARTGRASAAGALAAAIAEIEAGRRTTPLIGEPDADGFATVTFLARSSGGQPPRVVSDVTGWGESIDGRFDFNAGAMRRIEGTGWYSLEAQVGSRARIEYLFSYRQTDYRLDPHNPRRAAGSQLGGAPASEFVMSGYRPPPAFAGPPARPAGVLHEHALESRALGRRCAVTVYTPHGYRAGQDLALAVFVDSGSRQMPRVLDWLIVHEEIEPILAAFALPDSAGRDLPTRAEMRHFLDDELLEWLAPRYGVTKNAGRRAVLGISFGARDALDAALSSAAGYGRLGLLIPGRRIGREDLEEVAGSRGHQLRVAILAGLYDRSNAPTARSVRQALLAAGHTVDYIEVPEGHSPATFHHHLREVLISLFGTRAASD